MASAKVSLFVFNSDNSDCNIIDSKSLSIFSPVSADNSIHCISPERSSTIKSSVKSCSFTLCGCASCLSHLFIATIIGTFADLAWDIASLVCGITPSSAATINTTMSVTFAPLSLISVNAA